MKKVLPFRCLPALVASGLLLFTACDRPDAMEVAVAPDLSSVTGATLIECPIGEARAVEQRVLALGGVVALDGNSVVVPSGAILDAADIGIEVPASRHVRVELTANDQEHWQFQAPVTVTIDYSRCPADALGTNPLSVWLIDSVTGELLQHMGGVDDRLMKRITFETDHFSGYAIAN